VVLIGIFYKDVEQIKLEYESKLYSSALKVMHVSFWLPFYCFTVILMKDLIVLLNTGHTDVCRDYVGRLQTQLVAR